MAAFFIAYFFSKSTYFNVWVKAKLLSIISLVSFP
jgi:hypothetical protein